MSQALHTASPRGLVAKVTRVTASPTASVTRLAKESRVWIMRSLSSRPAEEDELALMSRWANMSAETLVLAEFVEMLVPFQYLVFLVNSFFGVNRTNLRLDEMSDEQFWHAVRWLAVLCVLELAGFVALMGVLGASQGWSPIRMLAFSLRTHGRLLMTLSAACIFYTISLMLRHDGCDFTFEFEWLR